ncbi:MAG: hypothetical protein A2010_17575 [Nitrospirae bacterium GWD2_57_9]|nr:MAG: hypothetical protein A2010_17575 [Nitrospirae bacterium GWD2_57_9]OGW45427.1 MAG: hypothetical protein A2078_16630 [Nitrospirae bacterium GWC2_57_9]
MDRDEAATEYLAVLLGFRGKFQKFYEAAEILTDDEKTLMHNAVSGAPARESGSRGKLFFGLTN